MKCVCGYEYVRQYNSETGRAETVVGEKEFIRIYCNVPRVIGSDPGKFAIEDEDYFSDEKEVYLYACPVCGTVKMQKYQS